MTLHYETSGVCSKCIDIEIENNKIVSVQYTGGCNGNAKGISALVAGMNIDEVITRLEGINCSERGTSCPEQLAKALKSIQK